jgi:uncharacterized protein (TIGR02145 family)
MKTSIMIIITFFLLPGFLQAQGNLIIHNNGALTVNGNTFICCLNAPIPGDNIPSTTQIIWKWNLVTDATGYKWNTVNDFSSATDIGNVTTKIESGLLSNTAYSRFVWAYGACGISTFATLTQATLLFTCPVSITDSRDAKTYNTVIIGNQCWMEKNLNFGTRINGTQGQSNNGVSEKYCYDDLESNCDVYGGLYQWAEMVQYINGVTNSTSFSTIPIGNVQGICPSGWHIPRQNEWNTLTSFLGDWSVAGGKLKETGTLHWASPNTGATNSSGFTALPAGFLSVIGTWIEFNALTGVSRLWAMEEYTSTKALVNILDNRNSALFPWQDEKVLGNTLRCLKD